MVLHVVVHVPVQVPMDWIHVHRPTVQTVVQCVLSQARVLGQAVNDQQPRAEQIDEPDKQ